MGRARASGAAMAARAMLTGFMVERVWAWYYSRYHMAGAVALYIDYVFT